MPPARKPRKKTRDDFMFIQSVRLPIEWQEQLKQAFQDWSMEQVKKGVTPKKTDFVRFVFEEFLKNLGK